VVAAICWMTENPERGVCVPDDLPHEYILEKANPYLGRSLSIRSDWTPLKDTTDFFGLGPRRVRNPRDPWQFRNFLLKDGT
jgi:homospermidine synthase